MMPSKFLLEPISADKPVRVAHPTASVIREVSGDKYKTTLVNQGNLILLWVNHEDYLRGVMEGSIRVHD